MTRKQFSVAVTDQERDDLKAQVAALAKPARWIIDQWERGNLVQYGPESSGLVELREALLEVSA